MTSSAPILSCDNVTKTFGALTAVNDLTFSVAAGEILGIGGPNGAGKTTLFEVLSGLNPATSGKVLLNAVDITNASPEAICHAGVARTFQLNACFDSLTVRENVLVGAAFGQRPRLFPGLRHTVEAEKTTDNVLALLGLADRQNAVAGALPILDRKLLMLAGALATRPKLLLMDEPVGGLTHAETDQMTEAVRRVAASGVTIILIEHVMRFLVALSHRVMILHHGQKIYDGAAAGLVADQTVVDVYLGEGASARLAAQLQGAAP